MSQMTSTGNMDTTTRKNNSIRSHGGNQPVLPQDKKCPHCDAKFTRTTHLNRHLRNHTKEGLHGCELCGAQFTRSDLLSRHMKTCKDKQGSARRKSCLSCTDSKVKCDREFPSCSKCKSRGKECIYPESKRRASRIIGSAATNMPSNEAEGVADDDFNRGTITGSGSELPPPSPFENDLSAAMSAYYGPWGAQSPPTGPPRSEPSLSVRSSARSETDGGSVVEGVPAIASHLSSQYSNDMFEPFFANLFSAADPRAPSPSPQNTSPPGESSSSSGSGEFPFATSLDPSRYPDSWGNLLPGSSLRPAVSDVRNSSGSSTAGSTVDSPRPEVDHFLNLFYIAFLEQMPIAHVALLKTLWKPQILLNAMAASGALFVRTQIASNYISEQLTALRECLPKEFAKNPTDPEEQVNLILAVSLLQTLGLFHQNASERATSSIYHGMVVQMIRRTGLINSIATCNAENFTSPDVEGSWKAWAMFEMTKRCLWLSYLHDCCHSLYFATACSYNDEEMELPLPCDETLWNCQTSAAWFTELQLPSSYGNTKRRLVGPSMMRTLRSMTAKELLQNPQPITPFSHFILAHSILRRLFFIGVSVRAPRSNAEDPAKEAEERGAQMYEVQYSLHNWLQSWLQSPDLPKPSKNEEPNFLNNALPFYWLGQVAILAYQDGYPPFTPECPTNRNSEARFRLMKRWLRHIRNWLGQCDEAPTLFWDELMKIRLKSWQYEPENETTDNGLIGFFPVR